MITETKFDHKDAYDIMTTGSVQSKIEYIQQATLRAYQHGSGGRFVIHRYLGLNLDEYSLTLNVFGSTAEDTESELRRVLVVLAQFALQLSHHNTQHPLRLPDNVQSDMGAMARILGAYREGIYTCILRPQEFGIQIDSDKGVVIKVEGSDTTIELLTTKEKQNEIY